MKIREETEKQVVNDFIGSFTKSQFLQSWPWGEFQKGLDRKIWRLGVFDNSNLLGSALVISHELPVGKSYLYCPRGPVVDTKLSVEKRKEVWSVLLEEIISRAKKQGAMFVKIEPPIEQAERQVFDDVTKQFSMRQVAFVQPQDSWYLDLAKSEEELLREMHQKTRYNIRLAERKGVNVRPTDGEWDFQKFWQLNVMTGQRDAFRSHSREYYYQMFKILKDSNILKLFVAEYNDQIIAVNYVIFFGDTVTYVHGASANKYRNVMAPHLLQWRQIQKAKELSFKYYDFWGVAPDKATDNHPWMGITRFKKSFGGQGIAYVGAYDLILDMMWYKLYKLAQRIRYN